MNPVLSLHGVSKSFGGVKAVDGMSFDLQAGMVTALIGPNGAGKSTIINLVTGIFRPTAGRIMLEGIDVTRLPMHRRAQAGIARTYQTPQMIQGLSAHGNVMAGAHRFGRHGLVATALVPWLVARENMAMADRAAAALERVSVPASWWERRATDLPYGIQRRVEIARALAQEPRLLLLDEPAAGLNPVETEEIGMLLKGLAGDQLSILLVEHDMPMVMSTATAVVVVNFGRRLAAGSPAEIAADPAVISAYLGAEDDEPQERNAA